MVKYEYRMVERFDGMWIIQTRYTKEYYEKTWTNAERSYEEAAVWQWETSGPYKEMKVLVEKLIAEENFVPKILTPPFPDTDPNGTKPWWRFW